MTGTQTIDLRAESGGVEYTWPLTIIDTTAQDITDATIELSLGTLTQPGEWHAPDRDAGQGASRRVVQLLVGEDVRPAAGSWWLWSRITDVPEIAPRKHQRIEILNDPT